MTDTDSTDNALKPCPFCGSSEIEDVMRTGYVQCQYCLASAKNRTAWNRRADLAPNSTDNARGRLAAYLDYINEITPNGNNRITNAMLCAGNEKRQQVHIEAQMKLAFDAGWQARADLVPGPLADPRVVALVDALKQIKMAKFEDGTWQCVAKRQAGIARAALAALSPTGGNADG